MRLLGFFVTLAAATAVHSAEPSQISFEVAESLLRYIETLNLQGDGKTSFCVEVEGQEISATFISRLKDTRLRIASCRSDSALGRLEIGGPSIQGDGVYRVNYIFRTNCDDCALQGKTMGAYLSKDEYGWHVMRLQGGPSF